MIINISGTHGSGKSTLVYGVMQLYPKQTPEFRDGRKKPIGYVCEHPHAPTVYILGAYVTPTGGCDTIPKVEWMFEKMKEQAQMGRHVLFEGILAQHSTSRFLEVANEYPSHVIVLGTSEELAIESVKQRRAERGDDRPFDPSNVIKEAKAVESRRKRLIQAGISVETLDRDEALAKTIMLLGLAG